MVGAEVKKNPGAEVDVAGDALRLMMLALDTELLDGASAFTPSKEVDGRAEGGTAKDGAGEELSDCAGFKAGEVEHEEPVTVTVAVERIRTVSMPFAPMEVKADRPFATAGLGGIVDAAAAAAAAAGDDEVATPPKLKLGVGVAGGEEGDKGVELGTIPPKLKVLVEDVVLNWRLFRLIMDGEAAGALRLITAGLVGVCGSAA